MLIIKQLDGSWNVNKPHLEELRDIARYGPLCLKQCRPFREIHRRMEVFLNFALTSPAWNLIRTLFQEGDLGFAT